MAIAGHAEVAIEPRPEQTPTSRFGRIDCDVHPNFRNGLEDLMQYLPVAWRRRVGVGAEAAWSRQVAASHFAVPTNVLYVNPVGAMRRDTIADGPHTPASDPGLVAEQLLDTHKIDRAVLLSGNLLGLGGLPDPDLAAALATAHNRWLAEKWLASDVRYRGVILIAPQDPHEAVAEIQRSEAVPGFVQVHVPMSDRLLGDRHYYPIYEAANDLDIPISVHPNAIDGIFRTGAPYPGGNPTYYIEWHSGLTTIFAANLISLICNGVFERFPRLRLVITEGGFAWLPDVMWRLDKDWRGLRDELPWLSKPPSDYILDHVRFTTQPFIEPRRREHVAAICDMIQAQRVLMFSTDYPHWDFDDPDRALAAIPKAMRHRVLAGTATEFYGHRLL
jgi:predicted TIM-barrel fold metal-dependent hydrolase